MAAQFQSGLLFVWSQKAVRRKKPFPIKEK
jgi:hypothetical protein